MALVSKGLAGLMIGNMGAAAIAGASVPSLCNGISDGVLNSFLATNIVSTTDTVGFLPLGAPGVGVGKVLGLVGSVLAQSMLGQMAASGLAGRDMPRICNAISNAIAIYFLSNAIVNTTHPLVVNGSGTGKIAGLVPAPMIAALIGTLASSGMAGSQIPQFAKAIATAFCTYVTASATITIAITGAPFISPAGTPTPSTGVGTGKVT